MTGKKSSVTGKFNYLPVMMTGILSRIISRPGSTHEKCAGIQGHPLVYYFGGYMYQQYVYFSTSTFELIFSCSYDNGQIV